MSWHFLQGQEVGSWEDLSLDGAPDALLKLIPTVDQSCSPDNATDYYPDSQFGTTSKPSMDDHGASISTSSAEGFLAKTSARQVKVTDLPESVQDFGSKCLELLKKFNLVLSSRKTVRTSVPVGSAPSSKDLPTWGMTVDGACWELGMRVHPIAEIECGHLLPTPTKGMGRHGWGFGKNTTGKRRYDETVINNAFSLSGGFWTPLVATVEWMQGWPIGWTALNPLEMDKFQQWQQSHGLFYQGVAEMPEEKPKHSRFAPSKMSRRIACPGSTHVDNKDIESSDAAKEGTAAGKEAEKILLVDNPIIPEKLKYDGIRVYLNYVMSLVGDRYVETEVSLSSISDEIYGTADCIVDGWPDTLHVIDLKYGQGVLVEAPNNAQLATYGLGALERFGYDFAEVWLTIVQPRIDHKEGPIRTWKTTPFELRKVWQPKIAKAHKKAFDKPNLFKPGNHCMWCSGAQECTKAKSQTKSIQRAAKKGEKITADNKKLAQLLNQEKMILQYLNLAKQEAFSRLIKNEIVPGYKLVKSFGRTTWIDEEKAKLEFADEQAFTQKLRTPTQLKKLGYDIESLSYRPEKGLLLVSEGDKRPAHRSAADDFDDDLSRQLIDEE
jgi:hypothetical protein